MTDIKTRALEIRKQILEVHDREQVEPLADSVLTVFCNAVAMKEKADQEIQEEGFHVVHSTGSKQVSPAWSVSKECANIVMKSAKQLGLQDGMTFRTEVVEAEVDDFGKLDSEM